MVTVDSATPHLSDARDIHEPVRRVYAISRPSSPR